MTHRRERVRRLVAKRPRELRVIATVERVDDPALRKRLIGLLADLMTDPVPSKG